MLSRAFNKLNELMGDPAMAILGDIYPWAAKVVANGLGTP